MTRQAADELCREWNERLKPITGLTPDGQPRLRVVWGESATRFVDGQVRLKYHRGQTDPEIVGYQWKNLATGETGTAKRMADVPDNAFYTNCVYTEPRDIPDRRFWVEWWVSPNHLAADPAVGSNLAGERDWNEAEGQIGQFPREGLWMGMMPLINDCGEPIGPGGYLLDYARRVMRDAERIGSLNDWRDANKAEIAREQYERAYAEERQKLKDAEEARYVGVDVGRYHTALTLPVGEIGS